MRFIVPDVQWGIEFGSHIVIAPSATVESEWSSFVFRQPDHAAFAYTYLCSTPTLYVPGKAHPLRYPFKPLWNLWVTDQEVIYYYTSAGTENTGGIGVTVLIGVRNDMYTSPRLVKMLGARRPAVDDALERALAELRLCVDQPLRVPAWALERSD